jgi:hypothetical protein
VAIIALFIGNHLRRIPRMRAVKPSVARRITGARSTPPAVSTRPRAISVAGVRS